MRWSVLLVLAACGSRDAAPKLKKDDAAVVVEQHGLTHLDAPKVKLPKQDSFVLDAPGAEPRAPLRYALAGPAEHRIETTLKSRHQVGDTWTEWTEIAVRDGFGVTPGSGGIALRPLPGEAVRGDAEANLKTWRELVDRRLSVAVDARGQLGALAFFDDPNADHSANQVDEVTQRLLATLVPLPADEVGVGAKWTVVWVLRQRPAVVKQTATYTLTARTDRAWTVSIELQRIGQEQVVQDAGLPAGTAVDVIALVRHYKGSVEIDPTRVLPVAGSLSVESRLHVRIGHLPGPTFEDQVFEDNGTSVFTAR